VAGRALLLSIRPQHAEKILDGSKTVELRRVCPQVNEGDLVLVYASSPVKALTGAFRVGQVVGQPPRDLWRKTGAQTGITWGEFEQYFSGVDMAFGIVIADAWRLPRPLPLPHIRERCPGFHPPRNYRYLISDADLNVALAGLVGWDEAAQLCLGDPDTPG